MDIRVIGSGSVDLTASVGPGFIVHNGQPVFPIFGRTTIHASDSCILGDLNGDGLVNLLDVAPFVDLVSSGGFGKAADFNNDGVVNLLDIQPFVDAIASP